MVRYILFLSLIAASAIFIGISLQSAPAQTPPAPANPDVLPDGPGKSAVEHDCLSCHGARTFKNTPGTGTADDWAEIVTRTGDVVRVNPVELAPLIGHITSDP